MKKYHLFLFLFIASSVGFSQDKPLNIIMIGAHPDDCDFGAGGTAILFSKMGHNVKFVSVTNGDAGHQSMGGGASAKIRTAEAQEAGKRFGIKEYVVLDNHDGELVPSLAIRLQIIREIRKWNADVVIAPRPNDYHPDHRYTGILVQDAAFMVGVPNIAADTPPVANNPVFLYYQDNFQKPNPFTPDIAVDISEVFEQKIYALAAHETQMFDWLPWIGDYTDQVPKGEKERLVWLGKTRSRPITEIIRKSLMKWYGENKAGKIQNAESFEICEYGKRPDENEIRRLFPMLK